jgi:hypothetical protein
MANLSRALAEISAIRGQLARGVAFQGYGPATLAATGALAVLAALAQARWCSQPERDLDLYLKLWVSTAAVSLLIICVETILRARRIHVGMAREMLNRAIEQFLPPIAAGALLTVVLTRYASQSQWMLPGLWQVIFSLGVFSSCQFLPRPMFAVGVWYLATGLVVLAMGAAQPLAPWLMGVPFGVGQLLVAAVLKYGYRSRA